MTKTAVSKKRLEVKQSLSRTGQEKGSTPDILLPDWLFQYTAQVSGVSWAILTIILRHTQQQREKPAPISIRQFKKETGYSRMTILRGLAELANTGLLFRELGTPNQRRSIRCYAIQAEPGRGSRVTSDGLVIQLLGGTYFVHPDRLVHEEAPRPRVAGLPLRQRFSLRELQQRLTSLPPLLGPETTSWSALRERVFARDNYTCFYCGREKFSPLHCDHVVPPARGGSSRDPGNLVTACGSCNASKGDLTLEEWLT